MESIIVILKMIWFFLTRWAESDKRIREKKERIMNEISEGIKTNNVSRINAGIDAASRL